MGDISIIEWIVYGLVSYGSIMMLIISLVKDMPSTKSLSTWRIIFTFPGIICSAILANSGVHINGFSGTVTTITKTYNVTANALISNSTSTVTSTNTITLISPVWITVHYMFFISLLLFLVAQIIFLMDRND